MTQTNPNFLSTLSASPSSRIVDNTDNIHSGIINTLNIATGDNRVISGFNITQTNSGANNTFAVASGQIIRNGILVAISASNLSPSTEVRGGNDHYSVIVVQANNTLAIREDAKNSSTVKVSTLTANDIPVAIVKYAGGSGNNNSNNDRPIQFLGYGQTVRGLSILNSGAETIRINANGTLTKGSATITLPSATGTLATTDGVNLATNAIDTANIQANAITTAKITDGNITTAKIADDSVTYGKLQNLGTADRVLGSTSTGLIGEVQIVTDMIASDAVTGAKIADNAINSEHYTDGSIDTAHIADSQITTAKLANDAVTVGKINGVTNFGSGVIMSSAERTKLSGITADADVVSSTTVLAALNANLGSHFTIGINSAHNATLTGGLIVGGNLTVQGTTTTVNTETIAFQDNIIQLNSNAASTSSEHAGLEVNRGSNQTNVLFRWNETNHRWEFTNNGSTYYNIPIPSELQLYVHPDSDITNLDTSGAEILDTLVTNTTGHITAMTKRTLTKGDLGIGNVENTAISSFAGTSNIATVGTIGTGTWQGTEIATAYIANNAITNAKIADDAVGADQLASNAVVNASVANGAAIAQSKIDGLSTALSGKEPSLSVATADGLIRTSAALKLNINGLSTESNVSRTGDFLAFYDASGSGNKLRKATPQNLFAALTAGDIPSLSSSYIAVGTTFTNSNIASNAAITADKLANQSGSTDATKVIITLGEKNKLAGIATSANNFVLTNNAVSNAHLAGSIANAKLSNSSVTVNSNAVALGASITLDTDDFAEGTNKYYTDERVDDRVSNLINAGEGIDTSYNDNSNALTISAEDATTSNKGVAKFETDDFTVSSGLVSIKDAGITNAHLAGSIAQSKITDLVSNLASKSPIADPTFTGEIGIGSVNISETELGILEGATVTTTELNYMDGVTSSIQTQIDSKLSSAISLSSLSDIGGNLVTNITNNNDGNRVASVAAIKAYIDGADGFPTYTVTTFDGNGIKLNASGSSNDSHIRLDGGNNITISEVGSGTLRITNDHTDIEGISFSGNALTFDMSGNASNITATIPDATTSAHGLMTDTQFDQLAANVSKLANVEASADVTDTANVTSAGALMDSELTDLTGVKGVTISTLQVKPSEGAFVNGDKTKLDSIEASADVTDKANVSSVLASFTGDDTLNIGDAGNDSTVRVRGNLFVDGTTTTVNQTAVNVSNAFVFEGATDNDLETTLTIEDPTVSDKTIVLPNISGTLITTGDSGTIANAMIASSAVTSAKIGTNAVITSKINGSAVTTAKIAADAVTSAKIADNAINSEHYTDGSIDVEHLSSNSVTTVKITDSNVTTAKVADDAITYAKIQNVSATDRILGRDSSGAGVIEEITPANLRTMINVADGANNYSHPTGAGNNHVPTGGSADEFLKYSASGVAVWATPNYASGALTSEAVQDIVGAMVDGGTESGIAVSYDDDNARLDFTVATLNQNTTGNSATATKITSITNNNIVQLTASQTLTNKTLTAPNLGTPTAINLTNATSPPTWNQSTTGSAATLTTARTIGGTSFNGSADIAVALAATATKIASITNSNIVQLADNQTLTNKTINASNNTLSNIANSSLSNSAITIDGSAISLGGSISTNNDNTFRTVTAGGETLGATETLAFTAGSNVTITELNGAVTITSTDTNTNTNTQLSQAEVRDFAGGMFSGNTETFITATYQTDGDTVDLVVPVLDEDNFSSNSAAHLATQQSIVAYVGTQISNLVDSSPSALNTLNELAAALGDDASFSTTTATSLGNRLRVDDNQSLNATQQGRGLTNLGITASIAEINILNGGLAASNIPALATSKITSGTFANARIAESNVTQHLAVGSNGGIGLSGKTFSLDIDGMTDIGAALVDADLMIVDDGAGGTNRKATMSRLKTYMQNGLSFTSNSDTTYTAGTGLDLSGTAFSVDVSDFMANGVNNRILTATGADGMNAEDTFTFTSGVAVITSALPQLKLIDSDATNDPECRIMNNDGNLDFRADSANVGTGGAILFQTSNSEKMRIQDSGNVGIGTNAPDTKLHLLDTAEVVMSVDSSHSIGSTISLDATATGGDEWRLVSAADGAGTTNGTGAFGLYNIDVSAYRLVVEGTTGHVGIGTATPSEMLHVESADEVLALFKSTDAGAGIKIDTPDDGYAVVFFAEAGTNKWSIGKLASNSDRFSIYDEVNNTPRLVVGTDGKIGIGDSNPLALLHLEFSGGDTTDFANTNETYRNMILLRNNTVSTNSFAGIAFDISTESDFDSLSASIAAVRDTSASSTAANHDANLVFSTNDAGDDGNTERMRITHDGLVGIGTTTPTKKLDVVGDITLSGSLFLNDGTDLATLAPTFVQVYNTNGSSNSTVKMWAETWGGKLGTTSGDDFFIVSANSDRMKFDGSMRTTFYGSTSTHPIIRYTPLDATVSNAQTLGVLEWAGSADSDAGDTDLVAASISAVTEAAFTATANTTGLVFKTATSETATEKMRITNAGNVGIGTTTPSYKLEVNGSFAATSKSFVIPHPTKKGKTLRHGSLEGPEHGVYVRGTLEDSDVIELPDYWLGLVDEDTITVQLTGKGRFQRLYVDRIEDNKIYVENEKMHSINCYYFVQAERKDIDKMVVEY